MEGKSRDTIPVDLVYPSKLKHEVIVCFIYLFIFISINPDEISNLEALPIPLYLL